MRLNINTISLEGPDLSGKSSLYNRVHSRTGFKWNIQDRSFLSMLCYARLYHRKIDTHRKRLEEDLLNLNNRYVILIPEWKEIEKRYHDRGDEIQDLESLKKLYNIFLEEAHKIRSLPNVHVPNLSNAKNVEDLAYDVIDDLELSEEQDCLSMGDYIKNRVTMSGSSEVSPLRFQLSFDKGESLLDPDIMDYPPETKYYNDIKSKLLKKIRDEISGLNEYDLKQDPETTRRFVFSGDSCISYIHVMVRNKKLNLHVVCRSSDVSKTFAYDLRFFVHLCGLIKSELSLDLPVNIHATLNSAHVVNF